MEKTSAGRVKNNPFWFPRRASTPMIIMPGRTTDSNAEGRDDKRRSAWLHDCPEAGLDGVLISSLPSTPS